MNCSLRLPPAPPPPVPPGSSGGLGGLGGFRRAWAVCNEFCGPFVGGLLLAAGTGVALGATWVSYPAVSFVALLFVGRFRAARETPVPDRPESVNRQIADGLRHLWQQQRTMALILTVLCACWRAWLALMPLFATDAMGVSPQGYGAILSALGIGGLVGALVVTRANRLLGRRRVMFADPVGTFVTMAVPALTTSVWGVAAAAFAGGAGGTLWAVNFRTIGQHLVPDSMLGRYNAVSRLFSWGAMPLGAGLMGLLAEWCGVRAAFLVFAAAVALVVLPFPRVLTPAAPAEAFGTERA